MGGDRAAIETFPTSETPTLCDRPLKLRPSGDRDLSTPETPPPGDRPFQTPTLWRRKLAGV